MSVQHLIPIKKGQTDLPRKGGLRKSQQKRFSNILKGCKKAKCKNCKFSCNYKNYTSESERVCLVPSARAKSVFAKHFLLENIMTERLSFNELYSRYNSCSKVKELVGLSKSLIKHKKRFC